MAKERIQLMTIDDIIQIIRKDPDLRYAVATAKHSQACDDGYSFVGGPQADAALYTIARYLIDIKNK